MSKRMSRRVCMFCHAPRHQPRLRMTRGRGHRWRGREIRSRSTHGRQRSAGSDCGARRLFTGEGPQPNSSVNGRQQAETPKKTVRNRFMQRRRVTRRSSAPMHSTNTWCLRVSTGRTVWQRHQYNGEGRETAVGWGRVDKAAALKPQQKMDTGVVVFQRN
jgi:hypothetical protein